MSKTSDRILVIVDLLLGAAYADSRLDGAEQAAVNQLLCELLKVDKLSPEVESHIKQFSKGSFDLKASADAFSVDPPIQKRKLLELVAKVHDADDELDLDENAYLVELAKALGMAESEYEDLALTIELEDLRSNLAQLRPPLPPAAKKAKGADVELDIELDE
jgi:uncharacterized tellurite resistance protein B-like protein